MTETMDSSANKFGNVIYLDQSNYTILNPKRRYSQLLNHPYQFVRSVIAAISQQRTEASQAKNNMFDIALYFVFSKYAVLCLSMALLLNYFVISRSPIYNRHVRHRQNKPLLKISHKIRYTLRLGSILILLYALLLPLFEPNLMNVLFQRFLTFMITNILDTIICVSNNKLPFEISDYSFFEMAIQYFAQERKLLDPLFPVEKQIADYKMAYIPDSTVSLLDLLIIHVLEWFNLRKYRLLASSVVDMINLSYIAIIYYRYGLEYVPFIIRYRIFPKMLFTIIFLFSLFTYSLTIIIQSNLWFYGNKSILLSFKENLWNPLNLTGTEDFSNAISKFSTLFYYNHDLTVSDYQKELPPIKINKMDHLIQLNNDPSYFFNEKSLRNNRNGANVPRYLGHKHVENVMGSGPLYYNRHSNVISLSWNIYQKVIIYLKSRFFSIAKDGSNEIINENSLNSPKSSLTNSQHDESSELLIHELDADYNEDDDSDYVSDTNDQEQEIFNDDLNDENISDIEEEDLDILELILDGGDDDNDSNKGEKYRDEQYWLTQMTPVIGTHIMKNKRMTRSQYFDMKRNLVLEANDGNDDNDNIGIDSLCAVCKNNERDIILWPCKCFALCNHCRVSLSLRGYKKCVYCRGDVSGYSKVHVQ